MKRYLISFTYSVYSDQSGGRFSDTQVVTANNIEEAYNKIQRGEKYGILITNVIIEPV